MTPIGGGRSSAAPSRQAADILKDIAKLAKNGGGSTTMLGEHARELIEEFAVKVGREAADNLELRNQLDDDSVQLTEYEHKRLTDWLKRSDGRLKKLQKWYKKNVKPRLKRHRESIGAVFLQAIAKSQHLADSLKSYLPTRKFNSIWNLAKEAYHDFTEYAAQEYQGSRLRALVDLPQQLYRRHQLYQGGVNAPTHAVSSAYVAGMLNPVQIEH
jgi:hypothetical protein